MTGIYSDVAETQPLRDKGPPLAEASTADVLRLLGGGAAGAILMALGEGPLRTKGLTEQVPGYAPRTIYRYAGKLAELELIEREEAPGVPSKVVHSLADPQGTELYELLRRFAHTSLLSLPDGRIDAHAWASLGLLADLWEVGMIEGLSCEPQSPTDLARGPHQLSYHQINRRAALFKASGLLDESQGVGRRRLYALTEKTRRKMGLIACIARWRHDYVAAEEVMASAEMATLLRVTLPLVKVPDHSGKCLCLNVLAEDSRRSETVWARVEEDGTVHPRADANSSPEGGAKAKVPMWLSAILDGDFRKVLVSDEEGLVGDCLSGLHQALCTPTAY
ncbi:MAG TPA: winged helix-turn-helix transcriptional regulator [Solirubrobacterales bacterium]|nr:winged helix-turn-helix transcriptional regulator [Solirubrobacterales bacterium]